MNDKQLKETVDLKQCRKALSNFCKGTYRMCVPAQPDDDDMVLSRALDELEAARAEIVRLEAENVRVVALAGAGYKKQQEDKAVAVEALRSIVKASHTKKSHEQEKIDMRHIALSTLKQIEGSIYKKIELLDKEKPRT